MMLTITAICEGGPLHGQRRAVPIDQTELRALFLEPYEVGWVPEDVLITSKMGVVYECVYKRTYRRGPSKFEYQFASIEPKASTRLRNVIRDEEFADLTDKIARLARANFELSQRLEEYEEDFR